MTVSGYTRQSAAQIINGATIQASHFNNEYNQIQNAFDAAIGHTHDGTIGGGRPIPLTTNSFTGTLPFGLGGTGFSTTTQYGLAWFPTTTSMGNIAPGTAIQVLHGNAAGSPTWSALSLVTDVTGVLGGNNGGTNSAFFQIAGPTSLRTYTIRDATDTIMTLGANMTLTGSLTLAGDPSTALQAVTKQYADAISAGLLFRNTCKASTTVNLTSTYSNGTSGVGATLTNSTTQAAFSVDGYAASVNDRILVKNQTSTFQNGIYIVTTVGDGTHNWVLTRATDYDQNTEILPGDIAPVINGTANANSLWLQTATVNTVGTDAITFGVYFLPSQYLSSTLTLNQIYLGNSSNIGTAVFLQSQPNSNNPLTYTMTGGL